MKLFYDTNIIVDIISKRPGYRESFKVVEMTDTHNTKDFIASPVPAITPEDFLAKQ